MKDNKFFSLGVAASCLFITLFTIFEIVIPFVTGGPSSGDVFGILMILVLIGFCFVLGFVFK